ncbi:MAG: Hsp20/alpha crystallin family protein [Bacillota bacterium]|nr:Hsp20/alpha crystallin family protein [Bacillota bacterium]
MADLVKWTPFDEFHRMREDMNRLLNFAWPVPWGERTFPAAWGPSVDVRETPTHVIVSAEIPGVDPDDLDVTVAEDGLSLKGEVKQETDADTQGYRRIERRYGSFYRTIPFPAPVKHEQATADYRNGVLQVSVPKAEPGKGKATRLRINTQPKQLQ